MFIESLESRQLLSASAHPSFKAKPDLLTRNIIGSYSGFYTLGSGVAGSETMTIDSQTSKAFTGALAFDGGAPLAFSAKLSPRKQVPALGFGYKFVFPIKNGTTKLNFLGEFQLGANGFIVQMRGKLNGVKVPKPHGELNLSPDDRSTFLR